MLLAKCDKNLKERFPEKYSILLSGPPGVGKFEYCLDLAKYYLEKGDRVVFVSVDLHPQEIRTRFASVGLDLQKYEGTSFLFIDCYSPSVCEEVEQNPLKKTIPVSSFSNLEGIGMAINKAANELKIPIKIIFYTISTLFLHNSSQSIAKFFQIISSRVKTDLGFIIYAIHEGVHEDRTVNLLRSLVDGVLEMRFNENMQRELRAHHLRGISFTSDWMPFELVNGCFLLDSEVANVHARELLAEAHHNPKEKEG